MRLSKLFIPTLKEAPSDAIITSNKLMIRGALARKLANGLYSYLPFGVRVLNKISNIVREEMNNIGGNECLMPLLLPKDLLTPAGRWDIFKKELFRLKDRHNVDYAMGPTHEEAFTVIAKSEIQSYRDLPLILYQIHTKFRDEIRPRFGVIRSKEFIMKDAYSFHITENSLDETYKDMSKAYTKIFKRMGLNTVSVKADSGAMGGDGSEEFMVLSDVGEEEIIFCSKCDYRANVEKATVANEDAAITYTCESMEEIYTPNIRTIEDLEKFFNTSSDNFIKTLIYKMENGETIAVLIRGDLEINETKLVNALEGLEVELADEETVKEITGARIGFASPIGLKKKIRILADLSIKTIGNGVAGGNKDDTHIKNINVDRDIKIDLWIDLRRAKAKDLCPLCKGELYQKRGLELGHIFKLGDKYTKSFNFTVLSENNNEVVPIMGCYGIGINRALASVIEQSNDDKGIIFPISVAPYEAIVVAIDKDGEDSFDKALDIYNALNELKVETLLDDRNERLGVKLNDCDLIGIPMRILVGKRSIEKGIVEFKLRSSKEVEEIKVENIAEYVRRKKEELFNSLDG